MSLSVAVVGLGRIGSGYDCGRVQATPRSHVGAILQSSDYSLIAACDSSSQARRQFERDWRRDVALFASSADLVQHYVLDLAVVAVPPEEQFGVLKTLISASTRMIFCEKPFCSTLREARAVQEIADKSDVPIFVNFHRRWEPRFKALGAQTRELGRPSSVVVAYCKGTINYGSHIVDLLSFLFGRIVAVQSERADDALTKLHDPSYSCRLLFESGLEARLIGMDDVGYEVFDIDIFYPDRKFKIELGGFKIEEFRAVEGEHYPGYKSLRSTGEPFGGGPVAGLKEAYACLAEFARTKRLSLDWPSVGTSVYVRRVLQAIVASSRSGRRLSL
jgi:predicted dehydrogenase